MPRVAQIGLPEEVQKAISSGTWMIASRAVDKLEEGRSLDEVVRETGLPWAMVVRPMRLIAWDRATPRQQYRETCRVKALKKSNPTKVRRAR